MQIKDKEVFKYNSMYKMNIFGNVIWTLRGVLVVPVHIQIYVELEISPTVYPIQLSDHLFIYPLSTFFYFFYCIIWIIFIYQHRGRFNYFVLSCTQLKLPNKVKLVLCIVCVWFMIFLKNGC